MHGTIRLLLALSLFTGISAQNYSWKYWTKLNYPRRNYPAINHAVVLDNCRILVAGGLTDGNSGTFGQPTNKCEIVNACCPGVTMTADMNYPRSEHILLTTPDSNVIAINGMTAITSQGSFTGPVTNTVELYNRSTGTWSVIGSTNIARRQGQAVFISDHEVYIVGGRLSDLSTLSSAEIFDLTTGTSTTAAPAPMPVNMHRVELASNGDVIIAAGRNGGTDATRTPNIYRYNRASNSYTQVGTLPSAVRSHSLRKMFDGRLLITGGLLNESGPSIANFIVRETNGTYSSIGSSLYPRWGHGIGQISTDSCIVFGGGGSTLTTTRAQCEWINMTTAQVTTGPSLPMGLASFDYATVPVSTSGSGTSRGNVFIIGGVSGSAEMQAEVPRDSIFMLTRCTNPDSISVASVSDSCTKMNLWVDSLNACRTPSSIRWTFGDGTSQLGGPWSVAHTFPSFGTYAVRVTLLFGGCGDSVSFVRTVTLSMPQPIVATPRVLTMCASDTGVVLTATGGVRYEWRPSSTLSSPTGARVIARPVQNTVYYVRGYSANGCSMEDTVRVYMRNGSSARIAGGPAVSICKGSDSLMLALTSRAGVRSVVWSPKVGVKCDTCFETKVLPSITTKYTAMITDSSGCVSYDTLRIQVGFGSKTMQACPEQFMCFKNDSVRISVLGKVRSVQWTPSALVSCPTCVATTVKPAVTTTYSFVAVDSAGCSLIDSVRVTVLPKAVVDIDPDTTICGSTPLRVSVFGTYQRIDWTPASGVNCPTCPTVLLTPVPGKTVTYTVRGHNGNSADCDAVDSVRFRFAPGIEGQLSDRQICAGDSVVFSVRSFGGSLQWSPAIKPTCDTCHTYVLKPTKTTRYILTGDSLGCVSRDTMDVVIAPTTLRVPASLRLCAGKSVVMTTTTNADRVQWSPPIELSCSSCPNPVVSATQSRTYTVTAGRGACIVRDSVRVHVVPSPSFSVTPMDTTLCTRQKVIIRVRVLPSGSRVVWNASSDLGCTDCDSVVAFPSSDDAFYTARISTPDGCDSTVTVRVRTVTPPSFTVHASSQRICAGDDVVVRVTGDTSARFRWRTTDGNLPGFECDTCVVTRARPRVTTTFVVRGFAASGCEIEDSVRVVVDPSPRVFVSADTVVCAGERIVLRAGGGDVVRWSADPALSCTDCPQPVVKVNGTTTFRVRVYDSSSPACGRDTSVTVTALPCARKASVTHTPVAAFSACDSALSTLTVRNDGNQEIVLDSVAVSAFSGATIRSVEVKAINAVLPLRLPMQGDSRTFDVHLVPLQAGPAWVELTLFFRDSARTLRLPLQSTVERVVVRLPDQGEVKPDSVLTLNCTVSGSIWKTVSVKDSVLIHVYVDPTALQYESCSPGSDLPADWTAVCDVSRSTRSHAVFLLRGTSAIVGDGEWLKPRFRTLVPKSATTEARADVQFVSLRVPCVETQPMTSIMAISTCVVDLRQVEWNAVEGGLYSIRPNPARGSGLTIRYGVPFRTETELTVFDMAGRQVMRPVSGTHSAGVYELELSTKDLSPGSYVVRFSAMGTTRTLPFVIQP